MAKTKKKKPTMHKLLAGAYDDTECGITSENGKKTWVGVTCGRCLRIKEAQKSAKAKKKGGR